MFLYEWTIKEKTGTRDCIGAGRFVINLMACTISWLV